MKFSLLQRQYILFVWENTASTDDIKMRQIIQNKIRVCQLGKNRFLHSSLGKGLSDSQNLIDQGELFFAQPAAQWVKKRYPLPLAKMRYIRDNICTGYIRTRIYISITPGKQDTKCLIKKLINKSA